MAKLRDLRCEILDHPPYSPDLAPSDFYLFLTFKKFLVGKHFSSNEDVIAVVKHYFADPPESYFKTGRFIQEALEQVY